MLSLLALVNLGSMAGFIVGLINPHWVLIRQNRTRLKSCGVYFGAWLISSLAIGIIAPRKESLPVVQSRIVATKPLTISTPAPTPTPLPEITPTRVNKLVETEIGKPEISEQRFDDENNRGYRIEGTETRKFKQPDNKLKTISTVTNKAVSYGFIQTKTETSTDVDGILSNRIQTKTETEDGTTIEIKNTSEWGITTTDKTESKEVSPELKATLALTPRQYKADPEIQPDPEPTEAIATTPTGSTCADFSSQSDAQAVLPTNPRLDGNKDGVACESYFNNSGSHSRSHHRRKR